MPHINIKHFPAVLNEETKAELIRSLTKAVQNAFGCDEGVISIALEPVQQEIWHEQVYRSEIENRKNLLCKSPNY